MMNLYDFEKEEVVDLMRRMLKFFKSDFKELEGNIIEKEAGLEIQYETTIGTKKECYISNHVYENFAIELVPYCTKCNEICKVGFYDSDESVAYCYVHDDDLTIDEIKFQEIR